LLVAGCGSDGGGASGGTTSAATTTVIMTTAESDPGPTGLATTSSSAQEAGYHVVVIGDSLANPQGHCDGCTGFVEQFAKHVGETLGRTAVFDTVRAGGLPEAQQALTSDTGAKALVAAADVVVVEVGGNNALPDPDTGIGCPGSMSGGYIPWILTTNEQCLAQGVATYGQIYDEIFASIKELRAGRPTVYIATNSINGNIDPSFSDGLLGIAGDRVDEVRAWAVAAYDRWNSMLAARAASAGFVVVDIYHEFNGKHGDRPSGSLAVDGTHPSQTGHDVIAGKLAEVDLGTLAG
jgi:lysophospholipase L1-like esterase